MAIASQIGTANATLFGISGPAPTLPSEIGTANATLFPPVGPSPVFPSEIGTANATLIPSSASSSTVKVAEWNEDHWELWWFAKISWDGTQWVFEESP